MRALVDLLATCLPQLPELLARILGELPSVMLDELHARIEDEHSRRVERAARAD